jgi:hypothetical protein
MTDVDGNAPDGHATSGTLPPALHPSPFARLRARTLTGMTLAICVAMVLAITVLRAVTGVKEVSVHLVGLLLFVAIGIPLLVVPRRAGMQWRRLFGPPPARGELALILVMVPVVLATFTDVLLLYIPLSYVAPGFVRRALLENDFFVVTSVGQWALLMLVGVGLAPVLEEVVFRGLLLHRWSYKWGTTRGVVASAVAFALLHGEWPGKFLFAIAMSLLYLRTGKLWVPIVAHAVNNFVFIAPSIIDVLRGTPPERETLEMLRAQLPMAVPLLAATIVTFWAWRRYVWGDTSMRGLLRGGTPYGN